VKVGEEGNGGGGHRRGGDTVGCATLVLASTCHAV